MKKFYSTAMIVLAMAFVFVERKIVKTIDRAFSPLGNGPKGSRLKQGGFVLLGKAYAGYASGTIVELPASTEAALIASGQATNSAGPPTAGAVTTTANSGCVTIAAGASSVVVTQPNVSPQSQISATVAQAAADGTLLRVERIVPAAGSFTIYGTANATAATLIKWAILNADGTMSKPV